MARDAGRSPWRRALALVAATALLAGCAAEHGATVRSRERGTLSPIRTIQGGRLATRVDALGTPNPGALGGFQPLVFPVAVAMAGPDLYIADAGAGRLYRFEQALLALVPVAGVSALPGIRLQGGPDGSLYFLDPGASEIRRVARVGRPPPAMLPRLPASRYVEFAVDPVRGRVFAADGANGAIDRFEPTARQAVVAQAGTFPGPVATDGRALYLGDPACRCILRWQDGEPPVAMAEGELAQPRALAVGEGVVVALDSSDRSLLVVWAGGQERLEPARLGMLAPEGLAIAGGMLYVADGAGQAVHVFRLPSTRRTP